MESVDECSHLQPILVLLSGYVLVAALLLLYFGWEGGWWHKESKYESLYIACTLLVVPLTNLLGGYYKLSLCHRYDRWGAADLPFRQSVQLVLLAQITQTFSWPKMHPLFLEARPCHGRPKVPANRKGFFIARELDQRLSDVLDQTPALLPDMALAPALFCFFMFEEVAWSIGMYWQCNVPQLFAVAMLVLVLLALSSCTCKSFRTAPVRQHILDEMKKLIRSRDKNTLQFVLANVSVATLIEVCGETMEKLLTERALEANLLTPLSKAILLHALQTKGLRNAPKSQERVVQIMQSCKKMRLTELKNILDGGGNYHNLYKLVYTDISSKSLQRDLRLFLREQSAATRMLRGGRVGIKVLSDVDDTLYSSGGTFPKGCDRRFAKRVVYPGCLSLFKALGKQTQGCGPDSPDCSAEVAACRHGSNGESSESVQHGSSLLGEGNERACNLVFLSARPHVYKDVAEDKSYRLFRSLFTEERMHCMPTLIPGSLWDGLCAVLRTFFSRPVTSAWRRVGHNKHMVYMKFRDLYREYDFVFCGDNGQGDLLAGQLMLPPGEGVCQGVDAQNSPLGTETFRLRWGIHRALKRSSSAGSQHSGRSGASLATSAVESTEEPTMLAVLIHEVLPEAEALAVEPASGRGAGWREALRRRRLLFHRSYVGAAVALHNHAPELVTVADLEFVTKQAVTEMNELIKSRDVLDEAALEDFAEDVRLAETALKREVGQEECLAEHLLSMGAASSSEGSEAPSEEARSQEEDSEDRMEGLVLAATRRRKAKTAIAYTTPPTAEGDAKEHERPRWSCRRGRKARRRPATVVFGAEPLVQHGAESGSQEDSTSEEEAESQVTWNSWVSTMTVCQ